jgi:hypothetical protein
MVEGEHMDPVFEALNRAAEEVSPQDIDDIIAYLRRSRKDYESGVKPKKEEVNLVKALHIKTDKTVGTVRRL